MVKIGDAEVEVVAFEDGEGVRRIACERRRQIEDENYSLEHDSEHIADLIQAARCYVIAAAKEEMEGDLKNVARFPLSNWPWEKENWKPNDGIVRNLEKAGALIAAAIDAKRKEESDADED